MLPDYDDIIERAGMPVWYDQHGAPRYGVFHPDKIGIYHNYASFFEIQCQSCRMAFHVSYAWPTLLDLIGRREPWGGPPQSHADGTVLTPDQHAEYKAWVDRANASPDTTRYEYGDPPRHGGCAGETMASITNGCLSHWKKSEATRDWIRDTSGEWWDPYDWSDDDDVLDEPWNEVDHDPEF